MSNYTVGAFDPQQNLNTMVLTHEQQIKYLAAQILELKQLIASTHGGNAKNEEKK